jgi:hypothetical protein
MKKMALALALAGCVAFALVGCGDDDDPAPANNAAGSGGSAGSGSGGSSAGSGGSDGTGTGPGSSLKCTSSGKNAFETYGAAFGKVNDSIVGNVAAELGKGGEPGFGPTFGPIAADGAKLATLKQNLADFLVFAYGGPNNYKGKTMEDSHTGLKITQAQYDYFIANVVVKALADNGVPEGDISSCFAPVVTDAAFVNSIINR